MSVGEIYFIAAVLAFAALFVTGRRLRGLPKGRNAFALAVHKILASATAVLIAATTWRRNAAKPLATEDWVAILALGVLLVGTMSSGGLLSARPTSTAGLRTAHRVTSVLTVAATAASLYLLLAHL